MGLFEAVFYVFCVGGCWSPAGEGTKSVVRKACASVTRADYFCFPLFCCLEAGGQIIEDRVCVYMFISPFPYFSSPPLLVTPFSREIKQAAQPHFSNLLQTLMRGREELRCRLSAAAWPLAGLLGLLVCRSRPSSCLVPAGVAAPSWGPCPNRFESHVSMFCLSASAVVDVWQHCQPNRVKSRKNQGIAVRLTRALLLAGFLLRKAWCCLCG